jgi:hypothetical protein
MTQYTAIEPGKPYIDPIRALKIDRFPRKNAPDGYFGYLDLLPDLADPWTWSIYYSPICDSAIEVFDSVIEQAEADWGRLDVVTSLHVRNRGRAGATKPISSDRPHEGSHSLTL